MPSLIPSAASAPHPMSRFQQTLGKTPEHWVYPLCGGLAGAASGIVTCPLDVIKTKLQAQGGFQNYGGQGAKSHNLYRGLVGTAATIWKEEHIRGLYRGLEPMLLGYLPTWAVYLTVYERGKVYFDTKTGTSPLLDRDLVDMLIPVFRQLVGRTLLCITRWRCMLDATHKSYLGHQDSFNVTELKDIRRRIPSSMALQEYLGCGSEDVSQRRPQIVLFRSDTCSSWSDTRRHPVPCV